jgi:hypothetical protein
VIVKYIYIIYIYYNIIFTMSSDSSSFVELPVAKRPDFVAMCSCGCEICVVPAHGVILPEIYVLDPKTKEQKEFDGKGYLCNLLVYTGDFFKRKIYKNSIIEYAVRNSLPVKTVRWTKNTCVVKIPSCYECTDCPGEKSPYGEKKPNPRLQCRKTGCSSLRASASLGCFMDYCGGTSCFGVPSATDAMYSLSCRL